MEHVAVMATSTQETTGAEYGTYTATSIENAGEIVACVEFRCPTENQSTIVRVYYPYASCMLVQT